MNYGEVAENMIRKGENGVPEKYLKYAWKNKKKKRLQREKTEKKKHLSVFEFYRTWKKGKNNIKIKHPSFYMTEMCQKKHLL